MISVGVVIRLVSTMYMWCHPLVTQLQDCNASVFLAYKYHNPLPINFTIISLPLSATTRFVEWDLHSDAKLATFPSYALQVAKGKGVARKKIAAKKGLSCSNSEQRGERIEQRPGVQVHRCGKKYAKKVHDPDQNVRQRRVKLDHTLLHVLGRRANSPCGTGRGRSSNFSRTHDLGAGLAGHSTSFRRSSR